MNKILTVLFLGLCLAGSKTFASLQVNLLVDGTSTKIIEAEKPAVLGYQFFDSENPDAPLHHFHPMHGKEVHSVIVSQDLSHFAHVHPNSALMDPQGGHHHAGYFESKINQASTDPDNQDLLNAFPFGGDFFVFTESMPMGYSMTTIPNQIQVRGVQKEKNPLNLDPVNADGKIIKIFNDYQYELAVETYPHCGTFSVLLKVFIQKKDAQKNIYNPVMDLEPWLLTYGHAILISENGQTAKEKKFIHLHAVWPLPGDPSNDRGPNLEITTDNHGVMSAGVYKAWIQFKHQGQILTVPFVIDLKDPGPGLESRNCI